MSPEIGPERTRLNFAHAVEQHFSFLGEYGFVPVDASPTIVRYRRGDLAINIYHGRNSFELGFEIEQGGKTFSMSELVRAVDPERTIEYRNFAATTQKALTEGLSRLAKLVRKYERAILCNEGTLFPRLEKQRKEWAQEYALKVQEQQIRPKANAAFRAQDYAAVAELFGKIEEHLTGSDRKKLDFARKHLARSAKP